MIDSKNFTGPALPAWHKYVSIAYFKDRLYYLGGDDSDTEEKGTSRVDVRRLNKAHEIIDSDFDRWKMANRTQLSPSN